MRLRVLLFGDSITYGAYDSEGGWATRLVRDYLREEGSDPTVDIPSVYNLGFSGDTTRHLRERIVAEANARRSLRGGNTEFVLVFAVGINDTMLKGKTPVSSPEQYRKDLEALYAVAQTVSKHIMFVGLTPVVEGNFMRYVYSNDRIWQFETVLRAFAKEHALPFVPIYESFVKGLDAGEQLMTADGLHPHDAGHLHLYNHIKPKLEQLLAQA